MDRTRIAAVGGLTLVAALVVGLIATDSTDDTSRAASSSPPATVTGDGESGAATTSTEAETDGDGDADSSSPSGATSEPSPAGSTDEPSDAESIEADATASVDAPVDEGVAAALANPDVPDLPDRGVHDPLLEIDGWLQSDVESLEDLRGKVVAVQFWTFGCINCRNTMGQMRDLYERYGGEDFEIVGIHAPEFDFERDVGRIQESAVEQGITWPIVLDTEKKTFRSWQTERRFWPRVYLLDRDGHVRYDRIGEYGDSGFVELDAAIAALIAGA